MEGRTKKLIFSFNLRRSFEAIHYFAILFALCSSTVMGTVYFQEEFSDGDKWQERWILSEHPSQTWGFFILSAGEFYGHPEISKGVQTYQNGMKYGMSTKFAAFSNRGKTLVLQFTVKNEQYLTCGGGYIKLFNCSLEPTQLTDKTPYLLMFGPDQCIPTTFKMHVIFNYKGKYLELKKNILRIEDIFTHLYTLIIKSDNTYIVKIDNKDMASGKLKEDWNFLPQEEVLDFKVEKPKDWDEKATIEDPNDIKPKDWDEPEYIPDPMSTRPYDWDDHLDGDWEPPLIQNPNFKGEWKPRKIPNPNYKGPWVRPRTKNPNYIDDPELYKFDEICAVGIDIWQEEAGTIFDNILITDDVDFAEKHSWETWGSHRDAEREMAKKLQKPKRHKRKPIHTEL